MYGCVYYGVKEVLILNDGFMVPSSMSCYAILAELLRVNNCMLNLTGYGCTLVMWLELIPVGL